VAVSIGRIVAGIKTQSKIVGTASQHVNLAYVYIIIIIIIFIY